MPLQTCCIRLALTFNRIFPNASNVMLTVLPYDSSQSNALAWFWCREDFRARVFSTVMFTT